MVKVAKLPLRGVVEVSGADRVAFLNGLVSNDVARVAPGRAVWAALLTAQGKWLADFFILADGDRLLLDCERAQAPMLVQRLGRYRLRADARLADLSNDLGVFAAWDGVPEGGVAAPDPRLPDAGFRVLAPDLATNADAADYDAHRLALGLPDGSRDMEAEKSVLLEGGFDELGGIDWGKGCYMGQELTARTRYRGLLKRRLMPVSAAALPPPGTPVLAGGVEVGVMRSAAGGRGLALLRLDALDRPLESGGEALAVNRHDWMRMPN